MLKAPDEWFNIASRKPPFEGVFFSTVFVLYWAMPPTESGWHDVQRVLQLAVLAFFSVFCAFQSGVSIWLNRTHAILLSLVGVLGLISVLRIESGLRWGGVEFCHVSLLVLFILYLSNRLVDFSDERFLNWVVAVCALYSFATVALWFAMSEAGLDAAQNTIFPGFANPRGLGSWVVMSWPLLVVALLNVFQSGSHRLRYVMKGLPLLLLASIWICFGLASGARAMWLSTIVIVLFSLLFGRRGIEFFFNSLLVIFLGFVFYYVIFYSGFVWKLADGGLAGRLAEGVSLSGREDLWRLGLKGAIEEPLFGHGPMMFAASNNGIASHPHNAFIQISYEWGLIVASVVAYSVLAFLFTCWRLSKKRQGAEFIGVLLAAIGAFVCSFFDGTLVMPFTQTWFAVIFAWLLTLRRRIEDEVHAGRRAERVFVARYIPVILILFLSWGVWPELRHLSEWERATQGTLLRGQFLPRFWVQGEIQLPGVSGHR